ncbi:antirestriction protein ArdA [Streptomyces werraensis]|uniref:antirestriction protein ArdA n=1 Tax=Streptomyces werraensis TaxID=68284 RepID=UPI0036F8703F
MSPRIYVASLSDYVAGYLHGEWIDADQDADDIHEAVQAMLKKSPVARKYGDVAEEWAIHDYEGFADIEISEHDSFERVAALAKLLDKHPAALVAHFVNDGHELHAIPDLISDRLCHTSEEYTEVRAVAEMKHEDLEGREDVPQDIKDRYGWQLAQIMAEDELNGGEWFTIHVQFEGHNTIYVLSNG